MQFFYSSCNVTQHPYYTYKCCNIRCHCVTQKNYLHNLPYVFHFFTTVVMYYNTCYLNKNNLTYAAIVIKHNTRLNILYIAQNCLSILQADTKYMQYQHIYTQAKSTIKPLL